MINKKAVKKYCRGVRANLYCPNKIKQQLIRGLYEELMDFPAENLSSQEAYTKLVEEYGTPSKTASDLLSALDSADLIETTQQVGRKMRLAFGVTLSCMVIAFLGFMLWLVSEANSMLGVHYIDEQLQVIENNTIVHEFPDGVSAPDDVTDPKE